MPAAKLSSSAATSRCARTLQLNTLSVLACLRRLRICPAACSCHRSARTRVWHLVARSGTCGSHSARVSSGLSTSEAVTKRLPAPRERACLPYHQQPCRLLQDVKELLTCSTSAAHSVFASLNLGTHQSAKRGRCCSASLPHCSIAESSPQSGPLLMLHAMHLSRQRNAMFDIFECSLLYVHWPRQCVVCT